MHDTITEVTVTPADLAEVVFDGTVIVVTGTAGNARVTFAGDHRATRELLDAVATTGEPQTAVVEPWQILSTRVVRRCWTIGCKAGATEVITYHYRHQDGRSSDYVCTPRADGYQRRPVLVRFQRRPILGSAL